MTKKPGGELGKGSSFLWKIRVLKQKCTTFFSDLKTKWFTFLLKCLRWNSISNRSCHVMKFCSRWNFKLLLLLCSSYLFCRLRYHGQIVKDVTVFNVNHTDIFMFTLNKNKIMKNYTVLCMYCLQYIVNHFLCLPLTTMSWKAFCFWNKVTTVFPMVLCNWIIQIKRTQIHEVKQTVYLKCILTICTLDH